MGVLSMKALTIRLEDNIYDMLQERKGNLSVSAYLSVLIERRTIMVQESIPVSTNVVQASNNIDMEPQSNVDPMSQAINDSGLQSILDDRREDYELEPWELNQATRYKIAQELRLCTTPKEVWAVAIKHKVRIK